jgi:hypothetical protein
MDALKILYLIVSLTGLLMLAASTWGIHGKRHPGLPDFLLSFGGAGLLLLPPALALPRQTEVPLWVPLTLLALVPLALLALAIGRTAWWKRFAQAAGRIVDHLPTMPSWTPALVILDSIVLSISPKGTAGLLLDLLTIALWSALIGIVVLRATRGRGLLPTQIRR